MNKNNAMRNASQQIYCESQFAIVHFHRVFVLMTLIVRHAYRANNQQAAILKKRQMVKNIWCEDISKIKIFMSFIV